MCQEELDIIQEHLEQERYVEEQIITSIINPTGRIKFKDIRKISIGLSKKDILTQRCKKKSAFYNCFVMMLRMNINNSFKEYHVKVFNTGKLEIPGIQTDEGFEAVLAQIMLILKDHVDDRNSLAYLKKSDTVLINSNFNCGFFINRETLFDILKYKYKIQCIYDPCSYPGIQCKFYYNPDIAVQTGCHFQVDRTTITTKPVEVSFMIFRTGSILIVGMCNEDVLYMIYEYLKTLLHNEYPRIHQAGAHHLTSNTAHVKKKPRKRNIVITVENKKKKQKTTNSANDKNQKPSRPIHFIVVDDDEDIQEDNNKKADEDDGEVILIRVPKEIV
jgi:hypothetical protein